MFFFFKQKTAYEMRISDWSSDVCSSDLYDADYFGDTSRLSQEMRKAHGVPDGEDWDETIYNVFHLEEGIIRHFWGSELSYAPTEPKIGRASCRERVCQYV